MGKPGIEPGTSAYLTILEYRINHRKPVIQNHQFPHRS